MTWEVRVFDKGEPKTIKVKGTFKDHKEVKAYLKTLNPELKFIWAVPESKGEQ